MSCPTRLFADQIVSMLPRARRLGILKDPVYECVVLAAPDDFRLVSDHIVANAKTQGVLIDFAESNGPHVDVWSPRAALAEGINTDAVRNGLARLLPSPPY